MIDWLIDWLIDCTQIESHGDKNDQTEPGVEGGDEIHDGDEDVGDGGEDLEDDVVEQIVDAVRAAVHHTQNFSRFPAQMPP